VANLHVGGTAYGSLPATVDTDGLTPIAATWACLVVKNGVDTADIVTISAVGGGRVGVYKWSYNPAAEAEGDQFSLFFTATVNALPNYHALDLTVVAVERGNDTTPPDTTAIQAAAAAAITAYAPSLETTSQTIKAKTDNLIFTTAGQLDVQVLSFGAGSLTATAIAANALTSSKFAAGAFDAVWAVTTRSLTVAVDVSASSVNAIVAAVEVEILDDGSGGAFIATISNAVIAFFDNASLDLPPLIIAAAVRNELATELARIDVATSTRASQTSLDAVDDYVDSEIALLLTNVGTIVGKLPTATTITGTSNVDGSGYSTHTVTAVRTEMDANSTRLAKLNVTGVLAHTDNAATFKATGFATPANVTAVETKVDTANSSLTSIGARIGAFTGSGVNTVLGFFKALMSKAAATPTDVGGTFDATADSTEAIRDQADAAWIPGGGGGDGLGTGPRLVTLTVNDGTNLLQGVNASITEGATKHYGPTDVDGVVQFGASATNLTYLVMLQKDGYTFSPTTLSVTGDTPVTYSMTAQVITASDPGKCTGYVTVFDENGAAELDIAVYIAMTAGPGGDGNSFDGAAKMALSDADGLAQFPNMIQGAQYEYWRTKTGKKKSLTVPVAATYAFPESLGTYAVQ
jgi:hypothetical protein